MKILRNYILTIMTFTLITACGGGGDPTEIINKVSKNITVEVINADGSAINETVIIDLSGAQFLDGNQDAISSITFPTSKSFEANVVANQSIDISMTAKAASYVDSGYTLQIIPSQTDYIATLYMVKAQTGTAIKGIDTLVSPINNVVNAEVKNDIVLSIDQSTGSPDLTITIPKGTKLSDQSNSPVSATSATLVNYDPLQPGVLAVYPGGLNVMADVNGSMEQVNFKSAGFASIILKDSAGNKVKQFDQDITIAMQFREGITDNNGKIAIAGDIVPIWSYDEDVGIWKYEKDGTINDLDTTDGLLDVTFTTNHLTYYNFDWNIENVCTSNIRIVDSNGQTQSNSYSVDFKMPAFNMDEDLVYDGSLLLQNVPTMATPWEIEIKDASTNEVKGQLSSSESICGDQTVVIDAGSEPNPQDNIEVYDVSVVGTSGVDCESFNGSYTLTDGTEISGAVGGYSVSGTRNSTTGAVTGGYATANNQIVASYIGVINDTQNSGTWTSLIGDCTGTWSATLR